MPFVWLFLAAAGAASKDIVSKKVSVSISGQLSAFASFFFPLPLYTALLGILYLSGLETFAVGKGFFLAIILRGSTDAFFETAKMKALAEIELTTFSTIAGLNSVVLLLLSPIITGDPLTRAVVAGAIISVAGVLLTTFSPVNSPSRKGLFLSLLALMSYSLLGCFDRLTIRVASAPLSAFSMTVLSALILFPVAIRSRSSLIELRSSAKPLMLRAVLEVTNITCKLFATQYFTAPEVSALMQLNLVIAFIAGQRLFGEEGFWRRLFGILLVIAGAGVILYSRV